MEDKHRQWSSYPKDLPWQELKAKSHVDESIFQNKATNAQQHHPNEDIIVSGSGESKQQHQSDEDDDQRKHMSNEMKINKPEEESRPLPLPHQQVPQPDDFSTQALEQL